MRPMILIVATSGEDSLEAYVDSIRAHGGEPRVVRPGDALPSPFSCGVLLTGGGDLSERFYDHPLTEAERRTLGEIEPEREGFEFQLLDWAASHRVPVLGICRGIQVMNAHAGGSLIPDLPSWQTRERVSPVLAHRQDGDKALPSHAMEVAGDSLLAGILGSSGTVAVNSSHHQALGSCGAGLKVTAVAPDGVIEAVEDPSKGFWLGVQFHPERMWRKYPVFSRLFERFIGSAG